MKSRHLLLAGAVALALAACGKSEAPAETTAPAATPAATEAPAPAPAETAPAAPAAAPAATTGSKPATVADCATTLESNDMMQYNADSITVPASCTQFTINLKHVGKLAANVMGHNVVIAKEADMAGIAADGAADTVNHVKAGDARAIAFTPLIGGGATTRTTFPGKKLVAGTDYSFFCSFPGHSALMKGKLIVTR